MFTKFLLLSLLTFASNGPTVLRGELPQFSYPHLESDFEKIWTFTLQNAGVTKPLSPPVIYLAVFNFQTEDPTWLAFQKKWISEHPEIWDDYRSQFPGQPVDPSGNPFPANFYAFHYDGTDRIQINAKAAFLAFYVNGPDGQRHDNTGFGSYSAGHEMHHYALESRGIPGRLHHCLFLQPRTGGRKPLMNALAEELVNQKISSSYIFSHGLDWEYAFDPCAHLSSEDRALVEKYRIEL